MVMTTHAQEQFFMLLVPLEQLDLIDAALLSLNALNHCLVFFLDPLLGSETFLKSQAARALVWHGQLVAQFGQRGGQLPRGTLLTGGLHESGHDATVLVAIDWSLEVEEDARVLRLGSFARLDIDDFRNESSVFFPDHGVTLAFAKRSSCLLGSARTVDSLLVEGVHSSTGFFDARVEAHLFLVEKPLRDVLLRLQGLQVSIEHRPSDGSS